MIEFILNNKTIKTSLPPGMVVLDFIRYEQHLKGTKIGCREGDCGACTVLVGEPKDNQVIYRSMTSCLMPLGNAVGKHIVSVEGINMEDLSPVQKAIVDEGGTQCGFCTVGFVMSLTGFCISNESSNYENAIASIDGNICRCTGYKSLERASGLIVEQLKERNPKDILNWLVGQKFIPSYFSDIPQRLLAFSKYQDGKMNKVNVGGGTDLYVQKHDSMTHEDIHFLFDNPVMKSIHKKENIIYSGGSVTVEDIRSNKLMLDIFPNLVKHLKLISSTPIRNMATIAGNFVNASPIGDMTIFFLALDASIILIKGDHKRTIKLKDFYKGYKTLDKSSDEIIESVFFEIPSKESYFNFEKVSKRTNLDIASANGAIQIEVKQNKIIKAHVSAGGVFAYPFYLKKTSAFLAGKELNASTILDAAEILNNEIVPISDARGTDSYKRLLSRQLFFAHFIELFPDKISIASLLAEEQA